jgi:hypothetical protein
MSAEDRIRNRCFEDGELPHLLQMDARDPRQEHLRGCPRCQARLLVFREFLEDRSIPPGADPKDASSRLWRAFSQATRAPRPSGIARILGWMPLIPAKPVWVAAVSLIAAAGLFYGLTRRPSGEDRLRGATARGEFVILSAERAAPAAIVIRWSSVPGAGSYRVLVLDAGLSELARLAPTPDTSLAVGRDLMPSVPAGTLVALEIVALSGDRELAVTPPRAIRLP